MDYTNLDLVSAEEIEQEVGRVTSTVFKGFAEYRGYHAALLLAELHKRFEASRGKQSILGHPDFTHWLNGFCVSRRVRDRTLWYSLRVGRFLLPHVSEAEFDRLSFKKREILADLAKAGRLTQQFLKGSFDISDDELKKSADPLLGREVPWEERLVIDNHWAAIAALIQLGNILEYLTYTAHSGQQFEQKTLGEITTLTEFPRFPTEEIERSAKRIDVIWVKEEWPDSFFEVENTTNVTSGLQRMYQVLKSEARFFIVAPNEILPRFHRAVSEAPYKHFRQKYRFRSYFELSRMFQAALKYRKAHDHFFGE